MASKEHEIEFTGMITRARVDSDTLNRPTVIFQFEGKIPPDVDFDDFARAYVKEPVHISMRTTQ